MAKRRAKPALPPVVARIREGPPGPGAAAAWARLWQRLSNPGTEIAPAPGQEGRGYGGGKDASEPPGQG